MNALDILFVIIAVLATLRSLFRGLVREVAAIAGLIIGIALASRHYEQLAAALPRLSPAAAHVAAFVLIAAAVYALFALVSYLLRGALQVILLNWLDRGLGAALGLSEAVIVSAAILLALVAFLPPGPGVVRHSRLAPRLYPVTDRLATLTPQELRQAYAHKRKALRWPEVRLVSRQEGAGR